MSIVFRQLTFAREFRGLTQTALASKIKGLSQSNLSKFEKGLDTLSEETLERIIDYLDFPIEFFHQKITNNIENAHYRKKASLNKTDRQFIERKNSLIGYIFDRLGESLEFPNFTFGYHDVDFGFTPESIAKYIRAFFKSNTDGLIDICNFLESNGVFIYECDYKNSEFDGVSFITECGYNIIVINSNLPNDRKRFTLAHELGHIIMHLSPDFIIPEYRDKEDEANRFASELLMPEFIIRFSLTGLKISSLAPLKKYWGTSMQSIIYRAKQLHCINETKYKNFLIELSRKGYRTNEPVLVEIDRPTVFKKAYQIHKTELGYSDAELAKSFFLPNDVISDIFYLKNNIVFLKSKIAL